jgi:hypothetical protein
MCITIQADGILSALFFTFNWDAPAERVARFDLDELPQIRT